MSGEAGKGSKPRRYSKKNYDKNFDEINWKSKRKEAKKPDAVISKILSKI